MLKQFINIVRSCLTFRIGIKSQNHLMNRLVLVCQPLQQLFDPYIVRADVIQRGDGPSQHMIPTPELISILTKIFILELLYLTDHQVLALITAYYRTTLDIIT